jgi:parvulin-like peptidyl-prolyl isomerase
MSRITNHPARSTRVALWTATAVIGAALALSPAAMQAQTSKPAAGATAAKKSMSAKVKKETVPVKPKVPPQHIQVQHILIGFKGSVPGKNITRTQEEARKLAYEILDQARAGAPFDTLVKQNTDDSFPGLYSMSNTGISPGQGEYAREGMVPAFGNVGFVLSPGNIGIADYDPKASPFGWHIIKRVK